MKDMLDISFLCFATMHSCWFWKMQAIWNRCCNACFM